jgi:hypothetical protein
MLSPCPSFYKVHILYNWRPPYFVCLLPRVIIRMSSISESRYHGWRHSTIENLRRTPRVYINPLSSDEVRNGDKKGNGRTKKGARLGSDVGENSEDELALVHFQNRK